jgi:putative ABC transport system ATP-binding protein
MPHPQSGRSEGEPHAPQSPLLRVAGVSKSYGAGASRTTVLRGATFELARGETASLIGASGSGKSTLLSVLAGLTLPESGEVVFDGQDTTSLDDRARARLRANRIGVVMQSGNLIPFLTAAENVEMVIKLGGDGRPPDHARELLGEVGLGHRVDHRPRRLSGGEAQRVAVAMAMANEPALLLADDVTGELDSASAARVMQTIFDASRDHGLAVLYVTHNPELAVRAMHRLRLVDGVVGRA